VPGARTLLRALRAGSLVVGATPVLVLTALVAAQGRPVGAGRFLLTLLGLVALQAGVNVVNDLFDDASGLDADPAFAKNPFPLGSRALQSGALSRRGMWALAAGCFATGAACGIALNTLHPGNVVLALGAAGFALGWFYTAPPLRIAYHGAGEPVIFLLFGPLAGLGTFYVQTGGVNGAAVLLSCAVGVLATTILYLHHFPQHAADAKHGKKTPIVRLGPRGAGRLVPWLLAAPYALVLAAVALALAPPYALAFFLTAPLALRVARTALARADDPRAMTGAVAQALGVDFFGGLLLAAGLWAPALL
jgi:1,4-dihydroxy-2-naphthoate octaprenyltransferase